MPALRLDLSEYGFQRIELQRLRLFRQPDRRVRLRSFDQDPRQSLALGIVVVYLAMSINVYLESTVFGVFKISYGRIGPTEVRLILMLLNTAAYITTGWRSPLPVPIDVLANWTLGVLLAGMVVLFVGRFARNLYRLAKLEPQRFRWWEQGPEGR